jgi:Dyp-type peroxidase family
MSAPGEKVKQNGLTVITTIQQGRGASLSRVLDVIGSDLKGNGLIKFDRMETVHYAAWLVIPDSSGLSRLVLETNYDGDLDDHLDELIEYGAAALDAIYGDCEGYPRGGTNNREQVKRYLNEYSVKSRAYFVAFPGRCRADIQNAIDVYREATRYICRERNKGLDDLAPELVYKKLVHHFRAHVPSEHRPKPYSVTRKTLLAKVKRNIAALSVSVVLLAIAPPMLCITLHCPRWLFIASLFPLMAPVALLLSARFFEIIEARFPHARKDPTAHPVTPAEYQEFDLGLQNHLCTFATVKPSLFRRIMVRTVLFVGKVAAGKIFIFGKLGAMATIHFARWIVIKDEDGERLLFMSNFDGSWASYLGDFSELIGYGINAVWGNALGFPPTRFLFLRGAYNIEPYEQEVRKHFQRARVFYRAYPNCSVRNIKYYLEFRDYLAGLIDHSKMKEAGKSAERLDRRDIQGIVASGYDHLGCASFVFTAVVDPALAKSWLKNLVGKVTTADSKRSACVNIAFTWEGLQRMSVPESLSDSGSLYGFPHEFVAGMNRPEAAGILGDTDGSAQTWWQFGAQGQKSIHILVLLYANSLQELEALWQQTCDPDLLKRWGLEVVIEQRSFRKDGDRSEPFGFRDGISQPSVAGLNKPAPRIEDMIKAGEFVLGYENEYGYRTRLPGILRVEDPSKQLWEHPDDPTNRKAFGKNGTYLVFRKLSQNVKRFEDFLDENSIGPSGIVDGYKRELVAAKLVGRWRSGAPLVLAPDHDIPALADNPINNEFGYMRTDPEGLACPVGAHIRRANPRDSLPFAISKSLKLSRRHRIIRRGRKYEEGSEGLTTKNSEGKDQGLYFIALNGDLLRQFEFIQQNWMNNPTFNGLDDDKDPIAGDNQDRGNFTIQSKPLAKRLCGLPRFVTVRGGGYFFLPGMKTLNFLAESRSGDAVARNVQSPSQ